MTLLITTIECAPNRASLAREGVVDLRDWLIDTGLGEFIGAVESRQKAPLVFDHLALHQLQSGQRGRDKIKA